MGIETEYELTAPLGNDGRVPVDDFARRSLEIEHGIVPAVTYSYDGTRGAKIDSETHCVTSKARSLVPQAEEDKRSHRLFTTWTSRRPRSGQYPSRPDGKVGPKLKLGRRPGVDGRTGLG